MPEKIIQVTDRARNRALAVRDEEPDGDKLALFLEVTEGSGIEYGYDLYFDDEGAIRDGDVVQEEGGLKVVIPHDSVERITGGGDTPPESEVAGAQGFEP